MGDVALYSNSRINANQLDETTFVGVDNLLTDKAGKTVANYSANTSVICEYRTGDVLLGNIRPYLKKIWHAENSGGCSGDVLAIRIREEFDGKLNSRFLYHVLASDKFFSYNTQHSKGAKMPRGNKDAIMKFGFSIPELEQQKEIVEILDSFDSLVNNLSIGLPAELKARRQQYEYYRDKLLTFEEAA